MTQDEIIRMANQVWGRSDAWNDAQKEQLEHFAALVEQRVRSEIALDELAKISQELGGY